MRFDRRETRKLPETPRPFRFGLRAVFALVTVIGVWLVVARWQPVFAFWLVAMAGVAIGHRGQFRDSTFQMGLGALLIALAVLAYLWDLLAHS